MTAVCIREDHLCCRRVEVEGAILHKLDQHTCQKLEAEMISPLRPKASVRCLKARAEGNRTAAQQKHHHLLEEFDANQHQKSQLIFQELQAEGVPPPLFSLKQLPGRSLLLLKENSIAPLKSYAMDPSRISRSLGMSSQMKGIFSPY